MMQIHWLRAWMPSVDEQEVARDGGSLPNATRLTWKGSDLSVPSSALSDRFGDESMDGFILGVTP